jgi:predicted RNA-binding Zn-ribbon protein involved in translation (DUF1610 family)
VIPMSETDDPNPCPSCGAAVAVEEVLDRGACPSCSTDLDDLFALAQERDRR